MARKKTFNVFREAGKTGDYDELPMLPAAIDIQLHLSRNSIAQPFFLIFEKDTLLAQMSGRGRIEFRGTALAGQPLQPGDYVYLPAGVPHRYLPDGESVQLRYLPREAGIEGVVWFCTGCENELHREEWQSSESQMQDSYLAACLRFNNDAALRRCEACGTSHPALALQAFHWTEAAQRARLDG